MKPRHSITLTASVLPLLAILPGCALFSNQVAGVRQVDDLIGRIERVHLESEISKARVREALEELHTIVDDDFVGDPLVAFEAFLESVEASNEQAKTLAGTIEPIQESANSVFAQWEADLLTFSIPEMRNRSRARMEVTREQFVQVVQALEYARSAYDTFNLGLRDHATFLGNDFNPQSVREIQREVRALTEWGQEVDRRLDATLDACEAYVDSAALPGAVGMNPDAAQGASGPSPR